MDYLPEGGWMLDDSGYPLKDFLIAPFNPLILIWRKDLFILNVKQEMSWHLKCSNPDLGMKYDFKISCISFTIYHLHTHVSIRSLHEKLVPEYLPSLIRSVQSYLRSHICTCITDKYNIYYPNLAFITATARIYSLKSCIFCRCFHKSEGCLLNIEVSCVLNTRFLLDNAH